MGNSSCDDYCKVCRTEKKREVDDDETNVGLKRGKVIYRRRWKKQ